MWRILLYFRADNCHRMIVVTTTTENPEEDRESSGLQYSSTVNLFWIPTSDFFGDVFDLH